MRLPPWRQAGQQIAQTAEHRRKIAGHAAQRDKVRLDMAFGNNDQPDVRRQLFLMQADEFAQNPFDSVALRGVAAFFGHGRAHLPGGRALRLQAGENDKIFRKKAFALIIAGGKLRPAAQPVLRSEG